MSSHQSNKKDIKHIYLAEVIPRIQGFLRIVEMQLQKFSRGTTIGDETSIKKADEDLKQLLAELTTFPLREIAIGKDTKELADALQAIHDILGEWRPGHGGLHGGFTQEAEGKLNYLIIKIVSLFCEAFKEGLSGSGRDGQQVHGAVNGKVFGPERPPTAH